MRPSEPASPIRIRPLLPSDLEFADQLRTAVGWNQTAADWRRLLQHQPDGCFLAELGGTPAGTATTTCYGSALAWIGMLLVHPNRRGRGIGTALMNQCLDYLRGRGIRCIKLDATPEGQPIYERLGFKNEWTLHRWETGASPANPSTSPLAARHWNLSTVESLDAAAIGARRLSFLEALDHDSIQGALQEDEGRITGFGLVRPGSRATYLGPVVAVSNPAALLRTLLASVGGEPVYWDIPDQQAATIELARSIGFTQQRPLIRMFLGDQRVTGNPSHLHAISGPETG